MNQHGAHSLVDISDATAVTGEVQPATVRSATNGPLQLRTTWGSQWARYEKIYDIELGSSVEVAVRKVPPVELVHVRAFSKADAETTLHLFRLLRHRNIVAPLDAFRGNDGLYIAFEYMAISLEWIVRSPVTLMSDSSQLFSDR